MWVWGVSNAIDHLAHSRWQLLRHLDGKPTLFLPSSFTSSVSKSWMHSAYWCSSDTTIVPPRFVCRDSSAFYKQLRLIQPAILICKTVAYSIQNTMNWRYRPCTDISYDDTILRRILRSSSYMEDTRSSFQILPWPRSETQHLHCHPSPRHN